MKINNNRMVHWKMLISIICLFLISFSISGQGRLVLNNGAFVNLTGGSKLILQNGNANALSTLGTGGNLISGDETNELIWNIGANTGNYAIPFSTEKNGTSIPVGMNITTAGVGAGKIIFSTFETDNDDNSPYPSGVTHMGSPDNSLYTIDRFWLIDAASYFTKPAVTLSFAYDDGVDEIGGTNTIIEGNLQAQRFNPAPNFQWGDYFPAGSSNSATNVVSGVNVTSNDFHKYWTLTDKLFPLPIELESFTSYCEDEAIILIWTTATEINNDYFTLEQSDDGSIWTEISTIQGAGSNIGDIDYEYSLPATQVDGNYYRLTQTDYDGQAEIFPPIYQSCNFSEESLDVIVLNNGTTNPILHVNSPIEDFASVTIVNLAGQLVYNSSQMIYEGSQKVSLPMNTANGIYIVTIKTSSFQESRKLVVSD